jgi:hypothetical protein
MNTINFLNKHFSDPTGTACTQCKKVHRSLELSCACLRRTVGQRWESMFRRKRKRAVAVLIYRPFIRDSVNTNYAASRAPSQKKMQPSPILTLVTEIHYCPSKLCQLSIDNRRRGGGGCAPSTRSPPSSIYEHPISSNRILKPTQVLRDGNEIPSVVGPVPSSLR